MRDEHSANFVIFVSTDIRRRVRMLHHVPSIIGQTMVSGVGALVSGAGSLLVEEHPVESVYSASGYHCKARIKHTWALVCPDALQGLRGSSSIQVTAFHDRVAAG